MRTKFRSCRPLSFVAALVWMAASSASWGQSPTETTAAGTATPSSDAAVHEELRHLRDEILAAWQRRDIDGVLAHVDPNIVVTWQNGEVSRGPAAIREFYKQMMEGEGSILSNLVSTFKVDDLSILHGPDTAIAFGSIHDDFTFKRPPVPGAGNSLALNSRWTATLVRDDGVWKLASYHVSANVFSNPVQDLAAKAAGRIGAIIGFLLGVAAAILITTVLRRRKSARA